MSKKIKEYKEIGEKMKRECNQFILLSDVLNKLPKDIWYVLGRSQRMVDLKFRYILERNEELKLFDISLLDCEIESTTFKRFRQLTVFEGWSVIDRCQNTTLKDEDGKEIYRGDTLRNKNYPEALDAEVLWFEGAYRIKGLSHEADIEEYLSEVNEVSKVIGNVYEFEKRREENKK